MQRVGLDTNTSHATSKCKVYSDYLKRLSILTSGSKPLITSLTLSAQALNYASASIVRAIEEQIQKVEPSLKLPLLYLIDSVIKNHGEPYIEGFKANIHNVFVESFKTVQPDTQDKFERVLATWNNSKIFPESILSRINNDVKSFKAQGAAPTRSNAQVHVNPKFVPKTDSLGSPRGPAIGDKRSNPSVEEFSDSHRPYIRPPMPRSSHHNSFENHGQIPPPPRNFGPGRPRAYDSAPFFQAPPHKRFTERPPRNFSPRPEFFRPNRPNFEPPPPRHHYEHPQFYNRPHSPHFEQPRPFHSHRPHFNQNSHAHNNANYPLTHFANDTRPPPYPAHHSFHHDHMRPPMDDYHLNGPESHNSSYPPMPGFIAPSPMNSGPNEKLAVDPNLIKSLIDSGIINLNSGSGLPFLPQHHGLPDSESKSDIASAFNVSSLTALEEPRPVTPPTSVASFSEPLSVSLTQKDINLYRDGAVKGLYEDLSLQCRQCGLRYPSGPISQAKLDAHMDWHFRQNRKKKERATSRRFLSRAWFSTDEDWASNKVTEFDYQNEPAFFSKAPKAQTEIAQVIAKLEKSTVVVPADHAGQACPICQDKFTSCWSDEEEEWIYKNAVIVDNQVCHATCHADHRTLTKTSDSPISEGSLKDGEEFKKRVFPELNEPNLMV